MRKMTAGAHKPDEPHSQGLRQLGDVTRDDSRNWSAVASRAIALRIMNYSQKEIAQELCVSERAVRTWLMEARRRAELQDIGQLLDHVALPQAVDNLIEGLQNGNEKYTLATLGGRGAFSAHTKSEVTATETRLEIHITKQADEKPHEVVEGQIVGVPRDVAV